MLFAQLLLTLALFAPNALGPGLLLTRRLRLTPLERLVTSVGLSFLVLYLASAAIYLAHLPWSLTWLLTAGSVAVCATQLPTLRTLFRSRAVRQTLLGFAVLLAWLLLLTSIIRTYSGGYWIDDWLEHYDRARFFLDRTELSHRFLDHYLLPARPPMMNLIEAFFLAQAGPRFEVYQVTSGLLNLTAYFAASLLLAPLGACSRTARLLLLTLCLCSPFLAQNTTFAWTKLLSAFYVATALALYARTLPRAFPFAPSPGRPVAPSSSLIPLTFLFLAAGCLVHYSAAPFAIAVGLHYLYRFFRQPTPRPWRQLAVVLALPAFLLGSWLAWAILNFGPSGALASNTTVTDSAKMSAGDNLAKTLRNLADTLVPVAVWRHDLVEPLQSTVGKLRDIAFLAYQQNAFFLLGSAGGVLAIALLLRLILRPSSFIPSRRRFWLLLVLLCVPLGVATVGMREPRGLAHVTLQPLALVGLAALAAARLPRWLTRTLLLACALDFLLGILLHFHLQRMTLDILRVPGQRPRYVTPIPIANTATTCFYEKMTHQLYFIGDHTAPAGTLLQWTLTILILATITCTWRQLTRRVPTVAPPVQHDVPAPSRGHPAPDPLADPRHPR